MKSVGIYLAAGKSQRMGESKLALPVGKMSLGSLALETALNSSLQKVYIIMSDEDDGKWISKKLLANHKLVLVRCPTACEGQSASLRCGIECAQAEKADAAMIILADQPFITGLMINELIACLKQHPTCNYVATSHGVLNVPPILFSASMFSSLLSLTGDQGARSLLKNKARYPGKQLPCGDNRFVFDVDTKEDYAEFLLMMNKSTSSDYRIETVDFGF